METPNDKNSPQPAATAPSTPLAAAPDIALPQAGGDLDFDYPAAEAAEVIIKVVGVGGGGGNAVGHMYREGIKDVSFLVINTDRQALRCSPIPQKLQIGPGLGAGAQPQRALQYALDNKDDIREALNDGTKMVFVTAGMGGGTGTGASPIVAQVAREMGILTIGIVTIPFSFEGRRKIRMALEGVKEIKKWVDALLIVNNDRLCKIYPDLEFSNAFSKADNTLTLAARSISEIITSEGYINLDFADVQTTLENGGVAIISTGYGEGEQRVSMAIQDAINSPLLTGNEIHGAQRLLFDLCFSHDHQVTMQEVAELNTFVAQFENEDISVIWGSTYDDTLGGKVKMIILASGVNIEPGNKAEQPAKEPDLTDKEPQGSTPTFVQRPTPEVVTPVTPEPSDQAAPTPAETPADTPSDELPSEPAAAATAPQAPPAEEPVPPAPTAEEPSKTEDAPTPVPPTPPTATPTFVQKDPQPAPTPTPTPAAPTATPTPSPVAPDTPPSDTTESKSPDLTDIIDIYGPGFDQPRRERSIRDAYYIFEDCDLENESLISRLEQMPAYRRCRADLDTIHETAPADANSLAGAGGTIQF